MLKSSFVSAKKGEKTPADLRKSTGRLALSQTSPRNARKEREPTDEELFAELNQLSDSIHQQQVQTEAEEALGERELQSALQSDQRKP